MLIRKKLNFFHFISLKLMPVLVWREGCHMPEENIWNINKPTKASTEFQIVILYQNYPVS